MILNLEFDASTLSSDHKSTNNPSLHPNLPIFSDGHALRIDPRKIIFLITLHNIYVLLGRYEFLLAVPGYTYCALDFISYTCEATAKVNCRGGGSWSWYSEIEGRQATTGLMVVLREWWFPRDGMRQNRIRRRKSRALEKSLTMEECGCR
jgi:hypothetical protein